MLGHSAKNTERSMLPTILPSKEGVEFVKHPIVTRMFLRGIIALSRYLSTYNTDIVLEFPKSLQT